MLLSLRKNGLTSLFKEVRVFKEGGIFVCHDKGHNTQSMFGDRKGATKKLCDKDFAERLGELSGAICLKTLVALGNDGQLFRKFFGAVRAIFCFCGSFLAPDMYWRDLGGGLLFQSARISLNGAAPPWSSERPGSLLLSLGGCHPDRRLGPILGPSRSHPESEVVPSRFAMFFFTVFRTHPGPEVGAIPAGPGPILLPSVPYGVGPGRAETKCFVTIGASQMTTKFLTIKFAEFPNFIVMEFLRKNSVFGPILP